MSKNIRVNISALRLSLLIVLSILITVCSTVIQDDTIEVAAYGSEGTPADYVRPRLVAGWPAPFLADSTTTSVPFKLGVEDDVRTGPFLADVAFWLLLLTLAGEFGRTGWWIMSRPRS